MKNSIYLLTMLIAMNTLSPDVSGQSGGSQQKTLRHVVLVKFKETSSKADIEKVEKAFAGLSKTISLIKTFEWGTNNSPENLNQGLTHCFLAGFSTEKDRDDYLVHPLHKEFVALAQPHLDKVTVIDYWVKP